MSDPDNAQFTHNSLSLYIYKDETNLIFIAKESHKISRIIKHLYNWNITITTTTNTNNTKKRDSNYHYSNDNTEDSEIADHSFEGASS